MNLFAGENYQDVHVNDFWKNYRPKTENGRSLLYRYEGDGVVVYDNTARLSDESSEMVKLENKEVSAQVKKEIESAAEYGIF
jgi:hypothetical protein